MRYLRTLAPLLMLLLLVNISGCERKIVAEGESGAGGGTEQAAFVGSAACGVEACHPDIYASFVKTGHPYKLNKAADARQPGYYPYGDLVGPPDIIGGDWNQVSYVIGGYRWKARFIDLNGYIITGDAVQYNLETGTWVGYHSTDPLGTVPYDCGPCHMTNYRDIGHQDDLPGMIGTWDAGGIQCEECHGNGGNHVQDPHNVDMVVDRSSDLCGSCHVRGTPYKIPASGGFVKHHEQYNEILSSKHSVLECVDCHDPHMSLHPKEVSRDLAIRRQCSACHGDYEESYFASDLEHASEGVDCVECHMPKAAKSASGDATSLDGDVRSHLFTVNTDPQAEQFTEDGSFANPYLTLDYMCKHCHTDKDEVWMAQNAPRVHGNYLLAAADGFNGGQLFDKFWAKETGFDQAQLDTRFTDNADFYRCKSCHGWDMLGREGAYIGRGPKETRPNVADIDLSVIASSSSADELFLAIRNSGGRGLDDAASDDHPDYSEILSDRQIWDIVKFLKETRVDVSLLYELETEGTYPTGSFTISNLGRDGDATRGDDVFARNCSSSHCHGTDGTAIDLEGRSIGQFAREKAYELQHKVRFGQLGSEMGAGFPFLSIGNLQDLFKALANEEKYPSLSPSMLAAEEE